MHRMRRLSVGPFFLFVIALSTLSLGAETPPSLFGTAELFGAWSKTQTGVAGGELEAGLRGDFHAAFEGERLSASVFAELEALYGQSPSLWLETATVTARPLPWLGVSTGKLRFSLGRAPGRSVFDAINPLEDTEGFPGLVAEILLGSKLSIRGALDLSDALGLSLDEAPERIGAVMDLGLSVGLLSLEATISGREGRFLGGTGLSFDLGGLIVSAEGAIVAATDALYPSVTSADSIEFVQGSGVGPSYRGLVGAIYTAQWAEGDFQAYLQASWYGDGYDGEEADLLYEAMNSGETSIPDLEDPGAAPLGRYFLAASLGGSLADLVRGSLEASVDLGDGSSLIEAEFDWIGLDATDVYLSASFVAGGSIGRSDYGILPETARVEAGWRMYY